jgi:hypothetical protein
MDMADPVLGRRCGHRTFRTPLRGVCPSCPKCPDSMPYLLDKPDIRGHVRFVRECPQCPPEEKARKREVKDTSATGIARRPHARARGT